MSLVSPSQSNSGDTIEASDINNPINQLAAVINGGIDANNITDNSVTTAKLASGSVTPAKLATGASSALVSTSETTTSTSYADLATTTDTVTVTIGANGIALVSIGAGVTNNISNALCIVTFAASGTNTIAAGVYETFYQTYGTGSNHKAYSSFLITGLTPGSTTFKMKYLVNGGTGTFSVRRIAVVPL